MSHNSSTWPCIRNVGGVRLLLLLYVPAVPNAVTTGNGTGTNNVLKMEPCALVCV